METISKLKSNWQKSLDDVIQEMVAIARLSQFYNKRAFKKPLIVLDEKFRRY